VPPPPRQLACLDEFKEAFQRSTRGSAALLVGLEQPRAELAERTGRSTDDCTKSFLSGQEAADKAARGGGTGGEGGGAPAFLSALGAHPLLQAGGGGSGSVDDGSSLGGGGGRGGSGSGSRGGGGSGAGRSGPVGGVAMFPEGVGTDALAAAVGKARAEGARAAEEELRDELIAEFREELDRRSKVFEEEAEAAVAAAEAASAAACEGIEANCREQVR